MTVYTPSRTFLISLLLNFEFKSGRCKRWVTNLRGADLDSYTSQCLHIPTL